MRWTWGQAGAPNPGGAGSREEGEGPDTGLVGKEGGDGSEGERPRTPAELVRELQRKYESGEIDEKQLADLGLTHEELQAFGERIERKKGSRRVVDEEPLEPFDWGSDPKEKREARKGEGATVKGEGPAESREKRESFREVLERIRSEVSPEYRELLEEYYRALSGH